MDGAYESILRRVAADAPRANSGVKSKPGLDVTATGQGCFHYAMEACKNPHRCSPDSNAKQPPILNILSVTNSGQAVIQRIATK